MSKPADFSRWKLYCVFCKKKKKLNDLSVVSTHTDGPIPYVFNHNYCNDNKECVEKAEALEITHELSK